MVLHNNVMKNNSKDMFSVDMICYLSNYFVNSVFDVVINYSK